MKRYCLWKIAVIISVLLLPTLASSQGTYKFERMWPTLKQPWYFDWPDAVAIDSSGNVYIADTANHRIQKFSPDGTFITRWGSLGTGDGEFNTPRGITIDSSGNVYVADTYNYRIQKFTSDGLLIGWWGKDDIGYTGWHDPGSGRYGVFGSGDGEFYQPNAVAADNSGYMYVADTGHHRIQKFTSSGTFDRKWGSQGSNVGEFNIPWDITVDLGGLVYVADSANHRIQTFTSDGQPVSQLVGTGDNEFSFPRGVAVDRGRNIYVSDTENHRIHKCVFGGKCMTPWGRNEGDGTPGTRNGEFRQPHGLAVESQSGKLYVTDKYNHRIQTFTLDGQFVDKWGSQGDRDGEFDRPNGLAIDSSGNVFVTDRYNQRVQKFNPDLSFLGWWGKDDTGYTGWHDPGSGRYGLPGTGNGQFANPWGITVDSSNFVYVADTNNHRIQKFTSSGGYETQWGSAGQGDEGLSAVLDVAAHGSSVLYVSDGLNHRIKKYSSDGVLFGWWGKDDTGSGWHNPGSGKYGEPGTGDGEFNNPVGVAVDSSGDVYVADTNNHRIQKFDSDGGYITKWGGDGLGSNGSGTGDGEFWFPVGIEVDSSDFVYVADTGNNRVQKFDTNGQFIAKWGTLGSKPGLLNEPLDVAVNTASGTIYVVEGKNNRIQVFKDAIVSENPRTIIVAGRATPEDSLWNATRVCTNFAYNALMHQGLTDEAIYYLSADSSLDEVDEDATIANLETAITVWAVNEGPDSLTLYMNDHGGPDTFRLSETEIVSASDLASWLADFQAQTSVKVTVVYEACESGSFVDNLAGDNRIIITSTLPGEQAKFLSSGTISFSNFFWTHIFNGLSIEDAYLNATEIVNYAFSNQNPQLSGDASNTYIGSGVGGMIGDAPEIGTVSEPQEIIGEGTSAVLTADGVVDPNDDTIARVWAVIWPPDFDPGTVEDPLLDVPSCELLYNDQSSRYEGTYEEFNSDGLYQIAIYAMDGNNNTSLPQLTTVSRNYNIARRAIIIAGGSSGTVTRSMIETNAGIAYDALLSQLYTEDDIYFMSVTGIPGFDVAPSNTYLQSHLNTLATDSGIDNLDLTIYLIGEGDTGIFIMNEDMTPDILLASDLDSWLDTLQTAKPGSVTLVYDGDKSGSFISPLVLPSPPDERIVVTSTGADAPAYFSGAGDTCFSSFFWGQVAGGATLYNALSHAKQALKYLSRKEEISFSCYNPQSPLIDANGNAVPNEDEDYQIARSRTIGIGMKFADDPPQIESASIEENEGVVTIAAEDISTTTELQRVWAVIKPIDFCPDDPGSETGELEEVDLLDLDEDGRYEGIYTDPVACYKVSVYAMDVDGNTSLPKETKIYQEGGDIYEPDEYRVDANVIVPGHPTGQPHTFHYDLDEDWVKFYGLNGQYYTIEADNLGSESEPVIELYYEDDGIPVAMESTIINNKVSIDLECLEDGVYYVHLSNSVSGTDTGYELTVYYPYIEDLVPVAGRVEESGTLDPIDGATITTGGIGSGISVGGEYEMYETPGTWSMDAYAYGYESYTGSLQVGLGIEFITKDILMGSAALADYDNDGVADDDDNCPYHSNTGQGDGDGDGIGDACEADKGNVDGTGSVGPNDIQLIINIFLLRHTPTGYEYWAADVNNDGRINVSDVQRAINMLL